jgi:hypothetical protein
MQDGAEAIPQRQKPASAGGELRVHLYSVWGLFGIGIVLWLLLTVTGYGKRYAHANDGWTMGATSSVEITLVREDREKLACASDVVVDGLHCAYGANGREVQPAPADDRLVLRPYFTADQVLLLGSGLWSSLGMHSPLPEKRFTVVCDYHVVGAITSVALRWTPAGGFSPAGQSPPVGSLSGCVIPP